MNESKQQTIEAICRQNPSASREFLSQFTDEALKTYLGRVTSLVGQRGPETGWVRPRGPAVASNQPEPVPFMPGRAAASF